MFSYVFKMNELQASHEAMKLELESKHEQLQFVKQQHEMSLEGASKSLTFWVQFEAIFPYVYCVVA